jgi:hypothetical protein
MPVNLIKKTEWGLFYYHIHGYCASAEMINAVEDATQKTLARAVTIFDLLDGDLDMKRRNIVQIIAINRRLFKSGKITTHAAVLTKSRTLKIFVKAFELMPVGEQTKLNAFSSLKDGLMWLEHVEHEQELQNLLSSLC